MLMNMDLERADQIRDVWGKYLEVVYPQLLKYFRAKIPVELLPYSKE
jgi:hypothetical protein